MLSNEQRENIREWIAELRSGKYEQVRGALVDRTHPRDTESEVGFCCLGVAAMMQSNAVVYFSDYGNPEIRVDGSALGGWLDQPIANKFGLDAGRVIPLPDRFVKYDVLDTPFGKFDCTYMHGVSLARLNDEFNFTFSQIADFLEWAISVWEEEDAQ